MLDIPDDQGRFPLGLVLDRGDELGFRLVGMAGHALQFLAAFGVLLIQLGGAALEVVLALGEGLGAVFDALELLVEPLLAVGETGFAALEVTTQLSHLVLDRADLFLDFAAALGGLFGFQAGPVEDPGGLGLGASPDVFGFLGGAVELAAVRRLG